MELYDFKNSILWTFATADADIPNANLAILIYIPIKSNPSLIQHPRSKRMQGKPRNELRIPNFTKGIVKIHEKVTHVNGLTEIYYALFPWKSRLASATWKNHSSRIFCRIFYYTRAKVTTDILQ